MSDEMQYIIGMNCKEAINEMRNQVFVRNGDDMEALQSRLESQCCQCRDGEA